MDGVHRLSILKYNNIISDCVPLELLEITYDNNTINEIKEMLSKTTQKSFYNGWNNRTTYGYHSFNISNIKLEGQRQPHIRLNKMNKFIDFKNKTIIDFGCNNGGMLLHLPQIKEGWGLDYSEDCIIAANKISNILKYNNKTVFIQKDLNKFNYDEFIKNNNIGKVDIIFLLSLGSWIKEWKSLYSKSYNIADTIILETNNDKEGIPQLELFENLGANIKLISSTSNDDTTNNYGRKTYIITK
jgi:SAM-dependent methyltransferase